MGEDCEDLFSVDEARAWLADDLRFAPRLRVALRCFISLSERAEAAESAIQCEAQRHEATRAAVREYLAALFDCAPKCDRLCGHVATRGDSASRRCDRDDCNEEIMCPVCLCGDEASSPYYPRCAYCGADVERVVDRTRLEDLPHANALRAANAMMATNDNY